MATQCVSKVELSISCSNLLNKDVGSKSDPLCVLLQSIGDDKWTELDRTEKVENCQDPEFSKKLLLDYHFEKVQKLKLGVYDIDNKSVDLKDDDFLGGVECTLGQIVSSKTFTRPLQLKKGKPAGKGTITITAEEIKDNRAIVLEVEAKGLDKKDLFGKSDPFLEFFKQGDDGKWQLVHRTEVVKNNLSPSWKKFTVALQTFCNCDMSKPIKVHCSDYDSDGSHDLIGVFQTNVSELQKAAHGSPVEFDCVHPEKKKKKKSYKNSGVISVKGCQIQAQYTFLDYVMGGCQINFTMVACGWTHGGEKSFHSILKLCLFDTTADSYRDINTKKCCLETSVHDSRIARATSGNFTARPSTTSSTSMTTTGAAMEDNEMEEAPLDLGPPEIMNLTEVTTEDLVEQDVAVETNRERNEEEQRHTRRHRRFQPPDTLNSFQQRLLQAVERDAAQPDAHRKEDEETLCHEPGANTEEAASAKKSSSQG